MLGLLVWSPGPATPPLPGVVTVDLVAMGAVAAPGVASRVASAEPRPAPPAPRPAPAPQPVPAVPEAPKPAPQAPEPPRREAVLPKAPQPAEPKKPKERAQPDPEPDPPPPPPKPAAKAAAPKPPPAAPAPPPEPPPRREEAYEDVLAQLRAERGEQRPERVDRQTARTASAAGVPGASGTTGTAARGAGALVDAEVAVWLRAAKLHVEHAWVVPAGFERERLRTIVQVRLDAAGKVLGEPRIQQRSGNPWFDESVVRAIQKASPLPPPPDAGDWPFEFTPPGRPG